MTENHINSQVKLKAVLVDLESTLEEAIHHVKDEAVLIVDEDDRLCGILTDGDIRRAFLSGAKLATPVSAVMTRHPITIKNGLSKNQIRAIMLAKSIRHLPVVDDNRHPVALELLKKLFSEEETSQAVVMAGGKGTRLAPLTFDKPKPLLKVGDDVILDNVLNGLRNNGIKDVLISINYLGEQIKNHVEDGKGYDLNISYLEEKKQLGTAGSLALLNKRPNHSLLVMNADLITDLDFRSFCHYHKKNKNDLSVCVRRHTITIPYGVISLENNCQSIKSIEEKPNHEFLVNAGIYMLEPEIIDLIPKGRFFDMTSLIELALLKGYKIGAFPILEYWRDIGLHQEIQMATKEIRSRKKDGKTTSSLSIPSISKNLEIA